MKYIRVTSYLPGGGFTGCEHLYLGTSQVKALERFRREYPEHSHCIVIAENYDSDEEKNKSHFAACLRCGCVH